MTRKSRLSTAWQRLAPQIEQIIASGLKSELAPLSERKLRSYARTLACWTVRLAHSNLSADHVESLASWIQSHCGAPGITLAELFVGNFSHTGKLPEPLLELSDLARTRVLCAGDPTPSALDVVNRVHELLLWLDAPQERRDRGAYYTPQAVARTLLELAHERFIGMTGDKRGLGSPQARVLDFAAGTGAFFAAGLELQGIAACSLENWLGLELDEEAHAISVFCQGCQLLEANLPLEDSQNPVLKCGDSLQLSNGLNGLTNGVTQSFNVIVGNPPYAAFRGSQGAWLDDLLRGRDPYDSTLRCSYHHSLKQSAKNRKHSLADDYVRFLRLAHWQIEQSGFGVVALILNHGLLENHSFHDLRQSLCEYFDEVLFLDLHGNAKRRELTPTGERDESVFNIEQGTMLAVLSKHPTHQAKRLQIGHVYGLREEKIKKIVSRQWERELEDVSPAPPQFFFHCQRQSASRAAKAYAKAPSLADIFPLHSTAIVTARDALVVDFELDRLKTRISDLADLSIPDEVIRERYFSGHSHRTYLAGDTRSWKLDRARQLLASEGQEAVQYVGFWYRPWDYRWLAYSKHLIDWRRERFSPLLLSGENLSIIARRQSPPGAACNYIWTSDSVVLDGILRSDNRGTEFVFPLVLTAVQNRGVTHNVELSVARMAKEQLGLSELELFYVIVGLLHSKAYQTQFRDELCRDFPRILLPDDTDLANALMHVGRGIADAESMNNQSRKGEEISGNASQHAKSDSAGELQATIRVQGDRGLVGNDFLVAAGFPKFVEEAIWINSTTRWESIDLAMWELMAGAHQPIRRWLKQRKGSRLNELDLAHVGRMFEKANVLLELTSAVDQIISDVGVISSL